MRDQNNQSRRSFIQKIAAAGAGSIASTKYLNAMPETNSFAGDKGNNAIVLFQGDSITDGNRSRNDDWNHVMGHGYAYLVASRLGYEQPGKNFHFYNRGVSGNKITDLAARWQKDTMDLKPDVLSILVGVNDVNSVFEGTDPVDAKKFEDVYRSLLKQTKETLPGIQIVLCEPFLYPMIRASEKWVPEIKIRQSIVRNLSNEFNAIFIPLQDAFNAMLEKAPATYWIWDGVHPMPAGHELIARKWISIVKKTLYYIA